MEVTVDTTATTRLSPSENTSAAEKTFLGFARPKLTLGIFALALAIYLAVPVKDYFFDGIEFAQTIEDSRGINLFLFHPNHLLYTATNYALYRGVHALGLHTRALTIEVLLNSFVSALAAGAMLQVLLAISGSAYLSSVLTLAFAFSATWWRFSPNADAYVIAVFFLIVSFFLVLPGHRSHPFRLAITHAAAMLFHQLALMFYPVAVAGLLLQPDIPVQTRLRNVVKYSVTAAGIVIVTYCVVFRLGTGRLRFGEFMHWVMFHDPAVGFEFNFARSLSYTLHGTAQLLVATKLSLLGHDLFSRALLALALLLAALGIVQSLRYPHELRGFARSLAHADRKLLIFALIWIAMYVGFLFFWVPANQHYRPFYAAPIFLLAGVMLAPCERLVSKRRYRAVLLVAAFALVNFALLILPLSREENVPTQAFAHQIRPLWPPGTVIYYENYITNLNNWTMRYFNPQTQWRQVGPGAIPVSDPELQTIYRAGGTVWFDTSLADLPEWKTPAFESWLRAHTRPGSIHPIPRAGWHVYFVQIFPGQ